MSNNKALQILRARSNYQLNTSEVELLDGQLFHHQGNKQLYIGEQVTDQSGAVSLKKIKELKPIGAANLQAGEGPNSIKQLSDLQNVTGGTGDVALGTSNNINKDTLSVTDNKNNLAFGHSNTINGSNNLIFGSNNSWSASNTIAVGNYLAKATNDSEYKTLLGAYNNPDDEPEDCLVVIGSGKDYDKRINALTASPTKLKLSNPTEMILDSKKFILGDFSKNVGNLEFSVGSEDVSLADQLWIFSKPLHIKTQKNSENNQLHSSIDLKAEDLNIVDSSATSARYKSNVSLTGQSFKLEQLGLEDLLQNKLEVCQNNTTPGFKFLGQNFNLDVDQLCMKPRVTGASEFFKFSKESSSSTLYLAADQLNLIASNKNQLQVTQSDLYFSAIESEYHNKINLNKTDGNIGSIQLASFCREAGTGTETLKSSLNISNDDTTLSSPEISLSVDGYASLKLDNQGLDLSCTQANIEMSGYKTNINSDTSISLTATNSLDLYTNNLNLYPTSTTNMFNIKGIVDASDMTKKIDTIQLDGISKINGPTNNKQLTFDSNLIISNAVRTFTGLDDNALITKSEYLSNLPIEITDTTTENDQTFISNLTYENNEIKINKDPLKISRSQITDLDFTFASGTLTITLG